MEVQELRIGNYLTIDGVLVRVRSVYSFTNGSFKNNEGTVEAYRYDSIFEPKKISAGINRFEPIPLTKEWLVKFGFTYSDDIDNLNRDFIKGIFYVQEHLDCNDFICCNTIRSFTQLKHVNQLQNLYFALTNQELTIKN
jgi:hypothetical protein